MSGGASCKCGEHKEPIIEAAGSNRPGRLWRVVQRYSNHSSFNGGHYTSSNYSSVTCLRCGSHWRTKANYVASLGDRANDEFNISCGIQGHIEAMVARGREPHPNHAGG